MFSEIFLLGDSLKVLPKTLKISRAPFRMLRCGWKLGAFQVRLEEKHWSTSRFKRAYERTQQSLNHINYSETIGAATTNTNSIEHILLWRARPAHRARFFLLLLRLRFTSLCVIYWWIHCLRNRLVWHGAEVHCAEVATGISELAKAAAGGRGTFLCSSAILEGNMEKQWET